MRDNGIGMTREEVVALIGTIAKSGTAEFLRKLKEAAVRHRAELIGQFGVGFYSTFMVADKVTLVTEDPHAEKGVRWESSGEGTYTIDDVDDAPQGTSVTLHLKPSDDEDQLSDYTDDREDPRDRQAVLGLHHLADAAGRRGDLNSRRRCGRARAPR